MNTRQLAKRLGVSHPAVLDYEHNEAAGKITLATLRKVARAMGCQVVYAIVPLAPHDDLDAIIDAQAEKRAKNLVAQVDQTMRLEQQGLANEALREQVTLVKEELKSGPLNKFWDD